MMGMGLRMILIFVDLSHHLFFKFSSNHLYKTERNPIKRQEVLRESKPVTMIIKMMPLVRNLVYNNNIHDSSGVSHTGNTVPLRKETLSVSEN